MRTPEEEQLLIAAKGSCSRVESDIISIAEGWLNTKALQQLVSDIDRQTNPPPGSSYEVASRMYSLRERLLNALQQYVETERGRDDE